MDRLQPTILYFRINTKHVLHVFIVFVAEFLLYGDDKDDLVAVNTEQALSSSSSSTRHPHLHLLAQVAARAAAANHSTARNAAAAAASPSAARQAVEQAPAAAAADDATGLSLAGGVQLVAFCVFEVLIGMFWPSMMTLRARYVPEEQRSTIINIFRIPLNLFVCIILWKVSASQFVACIT